LDHVQAAQGDIAKRAQALRAKGYSYALIERELNIPYLQAREMAAEYDARHGKPKRIIRTAPTIVPGTATTAIPVRDLRNHAARILRQVEKGQNFFITVSGRVVAEIRPARVRSTWVPRSVIETIIREAPLDPGFAADIDEVMGERIDEI
jgi:prevent-host-death family protein